MIERLHNSDHFLVVTPAFSAPSPDKTQKNPIRSWDSYKLDLQSPSSSRTPLPTLPASGSPESPITEVHNLITPDLLFSPQSTPSPLDTPAATQVLSSPVLSKVTPAPTPTPIPTMDASNALMMMSLGSMMKQDHFSGDGKVSVEEFESQLDMQFLFMNKLIGDDPVMLEKSKLMILQNRLEGKAKAWHAGLKDVHKTKYVEVVKLLKQRFPTRASGRNERAHALSKLNSLSQGDHTYDEYIDETYDLFGVLGEDYDELIAEAFVSGLTHEGVRLSVAGQLDDNWTVESAVKAVNRAIKVLRITKSVGQKSVDKPERDDSTFSEKPNQDVTGLATQFVKSQERVVASMAEAQNRFLEKLGTQLQNLAPLSVQSTPRSTYTVGGGSATQGSTYDWYANKTCVRCGEKGHISTMCRGKALPEDQQRKLKDDIMRAQELRNQRQGRPAVPGSTPSISQVNSVEMDEQEVEHVSSALADMTMSTERLAMEIAALSVEEKASVMAMVGENPAKRARGDDGTPISQGLDEDSDEPMMNRRDIRVPKGPKAAQPRRSIRMMQGHVKWDPLASLRDTMVVGMSWANLVDLAPSVKSLVANGMKIDRPPKGKGKKKVTRIEEVHGIYEDPTPESSKVIPDPGGVFVNFHTIGYMRTVSPKKSDTVTVHTLTRILIDSGAVVNLIPSNVVQQLGLPMIPNNDIAIRTATNQLTRVRHVVFLDIEIANVTAAVKAYVVDSPQGYTLLLGRRWLMQVRAQGDYSIPKYVIYDSEGKGHEVTQHDVASEVTRHDVILTPSKEKTRQNFPSLTDDKFDELAVGEGINAVLNQVLREARREQRMWEASEYEEGEDDRGPDDNENSYSADEEDEEPTVGTSVAVYGLGQGKELR
ncbi:hypothetical protein DFH27DRAFT_600045 [Peziza echinospora]|nr:hypothetical protein DFH27DRAFT_600045 [Peziza echinospora]